VLHESSPPISPFILGLPAIAGDAIQRLRAFGHHPEVFDVTQPSSAAFFRLLLAGNALAFGGLGMPAWVQLDCCTLPSVMVGFCAQARDLKPEWVEKLRQRAGLNDLHPTQHIPLSEFCALPTLDPNRVMGVSLWSLQPGLGTRSKALGWLALNKTDHIGITQYRNTAVRTHCRLGPLTVLSPSIPTHDLGPETFLYHTPIPDPATLNTWITSPPPSPKPPPGAVLIDLSLPPDQISTAVALHKSPPTHPQIAPPGHIERHGKRWLCLMP
jgi:hypothetical protein